MEVFESISTAVILVKKLESDNKISIHLRFLTLLFINL